MKNKKIKIIFPGHKIHGYTGIIIEKRKSDKRPGKYIYKCKMDKAYSGIRNMIFPEEMIKIIEDKK